MVKNAKCVLTYDECAANMSLPTIIIHKDFDEVIDKLIGEDEYLFSLEVSRVKDEISKEILKIIKDSKVPLETKEIFERIRAEDNDVSRSKLMYRLSVLRGDGDIHGKSVGSGKGVWIWWNADTYK